MERLTDYLDDKEKFSKATKDEITKRVFSKLDDIKKQLSNEFLKSQEK